MNCEVICYDPKNGALDVRFETGNHYIYLGVPKELAKKMINAPIPSEVFFGEIADYIFNPVRSVMDRYEVHCPCGLVHIFNEGKWQVRKG